MGNCKYVHFSSLFTSSDNSSYIGKAKIFPFLHSQWSHRTLLFFSPNLLPFHFISLQLLDFTLDFSPALAVGTLFLRLWLLISHTNSGLGSACCCVCSWSPWRLPPTTSPLVNGPDDMCPEEWTGIIILRILARHLLLFPHDNFVGNMQLEKMHWMLVS